MQTLSLPMLVSIWQHFEGYTMVISEFVTSSSDFFPLMHAVEGVPLPGICYFRN
jgi:hypothetical protein